MDTTKSNSGGGLTGIFGEFDGEEPDEEQSQVLTRFGLGPLQACIMHSCSADGGINMLWKG